MTTKTMHPALALALAILSGCQPGGEHSPRPGGYPLACPDERPEICTQQYDPVCAYLGQGLQQTFSNACHACADTRVSAYRPGPCE